MTRASRAAWLPSQRDELLLRAGLAEGDEAVAAWKAFRRLGDLQDEGLPALQAAPLAWRNLSQLDPELPGLDMLKGVYRYVWVRNQVVLEFGGEVLRELHRAGIETLVLKGAALSVLYYGELGLRLMMDFDVLVPRRAARAAMAEMRRLYPPDPEHPRPEERLDIHHSVGFSDGPDREVDLHWYSLWQSAPDDDLWDASVPIEIAGEPSRALCPADQVVQICAHGAVWEPDPVLRWIPDTLAVIRSERPLDWDRVVEQAQARGLTLTLGEALGYLRSAFGAEVPLEVLQALQHSPRSLSERIGRRASTRPTTMLGAAGIHWDRYMRLKRLDPDAPRAPTFPAHVRRWWGHETYRGLLAFALRRAVTGRRTTAR